MEILDIQNIGDRAYDVLLEMIINQQLDPGQRLIEEQLAMELGISRTPLREAVNRLAKEGLVEIEPRKGARVKRFSIDEVEEVYSIRAALEGLATRIAASNIPKDKLKRLQRRFQSRNTKILLKADNDLHKLIVKYCKNKRLVEMLGNLWNLVQVFRVAGYSSVERSAIATEDHIKIINALINRNDTMAENLIKKHIEKARNAITDGFHDR